MVIRLIPWSNNDWLTVPAHTCVTSNSLQIFRYKWKGNTKNRFSIWRQMNKSLQVCFIMEPECTWHRCTQVQWLSCQKLNRMNHHSFHAMAETPFRAICSALFHSHKHALQQVITIVPSGHYFAWWKCTVDPWDPLQQEAMGRRGDVKAGCPGGSTLV